MTISFSFTEENYIKAIYSLQQENDPVSTNDLAALMETAAASVTDMLKKLKAKKLVHYTAYYGCSLSVEGKKLALAIIRRHRLWEYFLSKKLGFTWDEVHPIAEELEHVGNAKLIDKLDAFLGFPKFDPHGDPIPDAAGNLPSDPQISLTDIPVHQPTKVKQIGNQSPQVLALLNAKNIRIGTGIEVRKKFDYDHSLEVKIGNKTITQISKELAQHIFVQGHE